MKNLWQVWNGLAQNFLSWLQTDFITLSSYFQTWMPSIFNDYFLFKASSTISVTFDDLQTADNEDGCRDYVQFFDGGSEQDTILPVLGKKRVCGDSTPSATLTTSSNQLYIKFHSDRSGSAKGFKLTATSTASRKRRDENAQEVEKKAAIFSEMREKKRRAKRFGRMERRIKGAEESRRQKRSANEDQYDTSKNYDEAFWTVYDSWYASYDPFSHFPSDLVAYDWLTVYKSAKKPDYADLRDFALFSTNEIKWFGTQVVDFIAQCTFDGRDCDYNSFEIFQNPKFGNCFVFNSILNQSKVDGEYQHRSTSKTGQQYGLKLSLFTNTAEYIGVLSQNVGAQVGEAMENFHVFLIDDMSF